MTSRFDEGIAHLHRYRAVHGTSSPRRRDVIGGFPIGTWVATRRAEYRSGQMPPGHAHQLEAEFPDWRWNVLDAAFTSGIAHLRRYAATHGTSNPRQHDVIDGFPIGQWAANRRADYRKGRLSAERIEVFEREFPDWQWSPQATAAAAAFEVGIAHLHRYVAAHGTSNARNRAVIEGFAIGQWVANRRADYRRGQLATERIRRIEAEFPDWQWSVRDAQFDVGLAHPVRQAGFRDPEVLRDLGELLARFTVPRDADDVVTELLGVGSGHGAHPSLQRCSAPQIM